MKRLLIFIMVVLFPYVCMADTEVDVDADNAMDTEVGGLGNASFTAGEILYCSTSTNAGSHGTGVIDNLPLMTYDTTGGNHIEMADDSDMCFGTDKDFCVHYDTQTHGRLEIESSSGTSMKDVSFDLHDTDSTSNFIIENSDSTFNTKLTVYGDIFADGGSLSTSASANPTFSFIDVDCPGTDKDVGNIKSQYVDGADGSENADMFFYITQGGVEDTQILTFDESDDAWETSKNVTITGVTTISQGASPTISAAGNIGIDTSDDQLKYYGGSLRVIPYTQTECAVIESLVATDDSYEIFMANDAITITGVGCRCRGAGCGTLATFTLEDRGGNAMTITGTNPTCATTEASVFAAVTANNTLTAGEGLAFDVTNTPTTGDTYTLCFTYTVDAQ